MALLNVDQIADTAGTGPVEFIKGIKNTSTVITSATIIADADGISTILADATSGAFAITLPTLADNLDRVFTIKKTDSSSNTVTIDGEGAETIDGVITLILFLQFESVTIAAGVAGWNIISAQWGSGQYTPVVTSRRDWTTISTEAGIFARVSPNIVNCSAKCTATAIDLTRHDMGFSLPIASNFAATNECLGTFGVHGGGSGDLVGTEGGVVQASIANNEALTFIFPDVAQIQELFIIFMYKII